MVTVRIKGWNVGLRKVSMTQALQQYAGLSLAYAKSVTDGVLNGVVIDIAMEKDKAISLEEALKQSGVDVIVIDSILSFLPFEVKVFEAYIAAVNDPESLRRQVASATVLSREYTGHGTFTKLIVDPSCATIQTNDSTVTITKMVVLEHPALPYGACTVLFVEDGYIEMLECAVFGNEEWPEDHSLFTISLVDPYRQ